MKRSIEASTTIPMAFARAREVLLDDPGIVLSDRYNAKERTQQQFFTDLGVDLGAGASVHQKVTLQLGVPRSTDDGLAVPLEWQATGREQWLPTFNGELEVSEARPGVRLRLSGTYTVPLGAVGRFGDGLIGRRLARRSLGALVERLATRLESEVHARLDPVSWQRTSGTRHGSMSPAPHPVELREQDHSEIYVG